MRKKLLAVSCGIFFLLGTSHVFANHVSSPFMKFCEAANVNAPDTSAADGPIEPGTDPGTQKAQAKPARSVEDVALSERLQDLIANKLQQYVTRPQDRTAVEAFYRERDFAPLWVNAAGALPSTRKAVDFVHGVAADGLDPKDYPTPTFADRSPERLAADELTLTNSIATFVRHASTGRIAFSRVSGSIYFDLKSPICSKFWRKLPAATISLSLWIPLIHSSLNTKSLRQPLPAPEKDRTRTRPKYSVLTKTEAAGLGSLQRKLMPSLPIWSAGVGCREIWVLST